MNVFRKLERYIRKKLKISDEQLTIYEVVKKRRNQ